MSVAVKLREDFRVNAGLPMQIIGVLRNQELELAEFLKFNQCKM